MPESQYISLSVRQGSHSPHEPTCAPTPTRSPTLNSPVASSPSWVTLPMISWPTMQGCVTGPQPPVIV